MLYEYMGKVWLQYLRITRLPCNIGLGIYWRLLAPGAHYQWIEVRKGHSVTIEWAHNSGYHGSLTFWYFTLIVDLRRWKLQCRRGPWSVGVHIGPCLLIVPRNQHLREQPDW